MTRGWISFQYLGYYSQLSAQLTQTFESLCSRQVVMLFGEIDCREGLLLAVEKCKYDSLEEGIDATLEIYLEALKQLLSRGMELFVHPIPPVLNETRHIVLPFNTRLKEKVTTCAAGVYAPQI